MGRRLDVTGLDDEDHLAVIGAAMQSMKSMAKGLGLRTPDWMGNATPQGISTPNEELDYLPLSRYDETNSLLVPVDIDDELIALPQRPFRGERMVLTAMYLVPATPPLDALFALTIAPAIYVGAVQVGATQGSMPGVAFGATAFGVRLSMPVAGQGTRIFVPFQWPGVAAGARLIVAGGIFGRSVR